MGLAGCFGTSPLVSMELRWARRKKPDDAASALPRSIPVYISTLKKDINIEELRNLYSLCNHSCNRLSENGSGNVDKIVDVKKLRTAISRSDVVISVFCKPLHDAVLYSEEDNLSSSLYPSEFRRQNKDESSLGDLLQNALPLTPSTGQLVGFGRAYSDHGLTASIHDLMVIPSLQRMGIGRLIVNRIVRHLTSRDIYDIAALCFEDERYLPSLPLRQLILILSNLPFFKACGFGDDRMGSTTMMFTKSLEM
ncbi:PREDICTED: uncharacterized protein LOC104723036 isoform X1 [Camelina sativa]|uniref:Uncharacterized protein LOC104723036 isoform X1 n=1 Tax=Camelina sativa TaxID=90675 RepID=A0ABM0UDN0_CAMSA|nr:PREDICTED: uncharacterized protein LOC104723036 isoform X1 [Camelina sativa]